MAKKTAKRETDFYAEVAGLIASARAGVSARRPYLAYGAFSKAPYLLTTK